MIFIDVWQSSNDIHVTINHYYGQIWEIAIVPKLSYDLIHESVPKFMSCDLVPIHSKFATGWQHQTLCEFL